MSEGLLGPRDLELVKSLELKVRKRLAGFSAGEQRSPSTGGGIEFADYREYAPGDDVRQLDWTVYLRTRKLLVKLCAEEKELTLVTIVDASRSMAAGDPSKLATARRIACVLAGIALRSGNRAGIAAMGRRLVEPLRPERNKITLASVARAAAAIAPSDSGEAAACMKEFASRYGRKCVAVLATDLLYPDWPAALAAFAASGCEAYVLQVLSPEELDPQLRGEASLLDMEDHSEVPIHADEDLIARYREAMRTFLGKTREACARAGIGYALAPSDGDLSRLFMDDLRAAGLVC